MVLIITFCVLAAEEFFFGKNFKIENPSFPAQIKNGYVVYTTDQFFSSDFTQNRTAFLIGSSHMRVLDTEKINMLIQSDDLVTVYNLGVDGDTLEKRSKELNQIISAKPEIIFLGISYRDFGFPYVNTKNSILPDPQLFILDNIYSNFNNIFPSNPKLITRTVLHGILGTEPQSEMSLKNDMMSNDELRKIIPGNTSFKDIEAPPRNINALYNIIERLQANEIKIILLTTPLHKYYLDSLTDNQKKNFSTLLNDLEKKYGLHIYHFEKK